MGTIDAFQRLVWSPQFKQNCVPHRSKMGVLKSFQDKPPAFVVRVIRADDVREIRTGKEKVIRVAYLYAENDAYEHR